MFFRKAAIREDSCLSCFYSFGFIQGYSGTTLQVADGRETACSGSSPG